VRLSERETSSCHLRASVQWFAAEQRVTKGLLVEFNSSLLSFAAPPDFHCVLPIYERKKVEKTKSKYLNTKGI